MAGRIRSIKPEFWTDEKLAALDPLARLVFLGLISCADDAGRIVDSVRLIDGMIFPLTDDSSRESLDTLARLSRVTRYTSASGQRLIQINHWKRHQRVDKPSKHVLPGPDEPGAVIASIHADSRDSRESVARVSRDPRAPIMDHGPWTMEHGARSMDHGEIPQTAGSGSVSPKPQPFEADFEEVWKTYPKKTDKAAAKRAYVARRRAGTPAELLGKGVENYAAFLRLSGTDPKYIKNGSTFFGPDKPYEEWQEPRQPERPNGSKPSAVEQTMQVGMNWLAKYGEGDE